MKFSKYFSAAFVTLALLFIASVAANAQAFGDLPCDPEDTNCPIDNWVVAFALTALIVTCLHLHKKKKITA